MSQNALLLTGSNVEFQRISRGDISGRPLQRQAKGAGREKGREGRDKGKKRIWKGREGEMGIAHPLFSA